MLKRNPTTPKLSKGFVRSFILGITAFSTVFAASTAAFSLARAETRADAVDVPWAGEEEVFAGGDELSCVITSASLTDSAEAIGVRFASKLIEAYPNGAMRNNVFVVPSDPEFNFDAVMAEATRRKDAEAEGGEPYVAQEFDAYVYRITYNNDEHVVVPSRISYGSYFVMNVTSIGENVCADNNGVLHYDGIEEIVIPKTITSIAPGALLEAPETLKILCEAPELTEVGEGEEAETLPTYGEDWTDANVEWEYSLTEDDEDSLDLRATLSKDFGVGADFILGYKASDIQAPAYLEYKMQEKQGDEWVTKPDILYTEVPIVSTNNPYNAVGTQVGIDETTPFFNIPITSTTRVDLDSLVFHNLYSAKQEIVEGKITGRFIPDYEKDVRYAKPVNAVDYTPNFHQYFELKPDSFATIGKFFQFSVDFTRQAGADGYGVYPYLASSAFKAQKAAIDKGEVQIRYQFTSLNQTNYRFTLERNGGTEVIEKGISTPISYFHVGMGTSRISFLVDLSDIDRFDSKDVRKVELCNFSIKADLYNKAKNSIIIKSEVITRFAELAVIPETHAMRHINVASVLVWTYVIYVVAFAALAVSYYFYAKRRFRNDEFRRVNTKRFVINALKNFLGFGLILSSILFIIARWGLMPTSVVVFNPMDAFVIIFTILGLIFFGFTIKNLVVSFKNARKRKEAIKLKLDQDVADDGTN